MFKKTISYLLLASLIFSFSPLLAQAESGTFNQGSFNLETNTEFSIVINAQDLNEANNVKIVLEYNPTIISYVDFTPGSVMSPVDLFFSNANTFLINATTEQLKMTVATEGFTGSVSGSGELATITFRTSANSGNTDVAMNSITIYPADFMAPPIDGDIASPVSVTVTAPDTTAPVRSGGKPTGVLSYDTTEATISIATDEDAICHYSNVADTDFADSIEMTTTGGINHEVTVSGFSEGNDYNYYIRCKDTADNTNTDDYLVSFSVDSAPVVLPTPVLSFAQTDYQNIDNNTSINLVLNANDLAEVSSVDVVLKYNPNIITYLDFTPGVLMAPVNSMFSSAATSSIDNNTEQLTMTVATDMFSSVSGSGELANINFITNSNGGSTMIKIVNFTVYPTDFMSPIINGDTGSPATISVITPDTTAPVRSGGEPTGVLSYDTTEATISIATDEDAICHYSNVADTDFADSIEMTTTGGTNHEVTVSGLSEGNDYNYYIRCKDTADNTNTDDYLVSFSVDSAPVVTPEPTPTTPTGSGGSSYIILLKQQVEREKQAEAKKEEKSEEVKVLGFSQFAKGSLVRTSDHKIYLLGIKLKKYIPNMQGLIKYSGETIFDVQNEEVKKYKTCPYSDGDLVREKGKSKVFQIVNGGLRKVLNIDELRKNFSGKTIFNITPEEMSLYNY